MNSVKYMTVVELVKRRVLNGDYMFTDSPSERGLAQEAGVSYMTARRAVQELLKQKILVRMKNGRLQPNSRYSNGHLCRQVAFIAPAWHASSFNQWRGAIKKTVEGHGCVIRSVTYDNHDDPVIYDALDGNFDLIFLISINPSDTLKLRLERVRGKVISVFKDMSDLGILSIDGVSPGLIEEMVGKLAKLGHRRMAFFNTQPESTVISLRREAWEQAVSSRSFPKIIINEPAEPFHDSCAKAYEVFLKLAKKGPLPFTAVFSTTVHSAKGILRAIHECGMKCPGDISIFSMGELSDARLSVPAIATIDTDNLEKYVDDIYLDIIKGKVDRSRLHYCPGHLSFNGESIGRNKND